MADRAKEAANMQKTTVLMQEEYRNHKTYLRKFIGYILQGVTNPA